MSDPALVDMLLRLLRMKHVVDAWVECSKGEKRAVLSIRAPREACMPGVKTVGYTVVVESEPLPVAVLPFCEKHGLCIGFVANYDMFVVSIDCRGLEDIRLVFVGIGVPAKFLIYPSFGISYEGRGYTIFVKNALRVDSGDAPGRNRIELEGCGARRHVEMSLHGDDFRIKILPRTSGSTGLLIRDGLAYIRAEWM